MEVDSPVPKFQRLNLCTEVEVVAVAGLLPSLPMFGAREISNITNSKDAKSFPTDSIQHSAKNMCHCHSSRSLAKDYIVKNGVSLEKDYGGDACSKMMKNDHRMGEKWNLDLTTRTW